MSDAVEIGSAICYKLFGKPFTSFDDELVVYLNVEDTTLTYGQSIEDKAETLIEKVKNNYVLFLDDLRLPDDNVTTTVYTHIVTRTNNAAIETVKLLGCPNGMLLDYNLKGMTTDLFISWFNEWLLAGNKLEPGFWYDIISNNPLKKVSMRLRMDTIINKALSRK